MAYTTIVEIQPTNIGGVTPGLIGASLRDMATKTTELRPIQIVPGVVVMDTYPRTGNDPHRNFLNKVSADEDGSVLIIDLNHDSAFSDNSELELGQAILDLSLLTGETPQVIRPGVRVLGRVTTSNEAYLELLRAVSRL